MSIKLTIVCAIVAACVVFVCIYNSFKNINNNIVSVQQEAVAQILK